MKLPEDMNPIETKLSSLSESQLSQQVYHPEYSEYNIQIMFQHLALHDSYHMYKIEHQWLARQK